MAPSSSSSPQDGQQRQQQHVQGYNREEEYLSAQRAAVEAVHIGRETLEAATRQGEQLQNAENMADEAEYKLDRAARVLRGMTWTGWWANKFSSDILPPERNPTGEKPEDLPPKMYENAPPSCQAAAQALQNYHANLQVLETCETDEQRETCSIICVDMQQIAQGQVMALHRAPPSDAGDFPARLARHLQILRDRQDRAMGPTTSKADANRKELLSGRNSSPVTPSSPMDPIQQQQDTHLDAMSKHLRELGSLATNLNVSLAQQADIADSLDGKSDAMLYKSKLVTRRADQLTQKRSWTRPKSEFVHTAYIQHRPTGMYLAVNPQSNTYLHLTSKFNETCLFDIWQRQTGSKVFGLQSKYTNRWIGQNLLGQLVCSSYKFERREEWDAGNDNWAHTKLICASAGWGTGGFLLVRGENKALLIGGTIEDRARADDWSIMEYQDPAAVAANK
eukprot:Nitzschia sp. Nitz4//scaffold62_size106224//97363//98712//NITZ4_004372-RA/size106224-processed-gene-0.61-mRNA-1//-1//CDS//3329555904//467//frame0